MNRPALLTASAALLLVWFAVWKNREPAPANTVPEAAPASQAPPAEPPHPGYVTGPATRDGTGKFYLGREIAQVMGHQGINWLERDTRESEESPSRAIMKLGLAPHAVIADIGAGSGYYTFRLAPLVPKGKVVAVDIQPEMIAFLEKREKELGLNNVEAHLGKIDDIQVAAGTLDAALFVDAYHEFSHPWEMMRSIVRALRPGGRVFLLEYRAEDPEVPIKPLHKMSQEQAKREMAAVGLKWLKTEDFLPWQHFMVFEKPE